MTAMTELELLDCTSWLENEQITTGLRGKNKDYHDIYQMTEIPRISDEVSRGRSVTQPSSFVHKLTSGVISQISTYDTYPVVVGLGGLTDTEADDIEAYAAVLMANWLEGQRLLQRMYRGLLTRSHVVVEIICGAPDEPVPCQLTMPRIGTCSFPDFDAPGRPPLLSRRFQVLLRDGVRSYSGIKGEHAGAGQQLVLNDGKISYTKLSGERPVWDGYGFASSNKTANKCEVIRLYDGSYRYDLLKMPGEKGETRLVYQEKTLTDGVPCVVVPGVVTDEANPTENWRPILWPAFADTLQINRMRSVQATRSERVQPHVFQRMSPQLQANTRNEGLQPMQMAIGGPTIQRVYADEIVQWEPIADPEMAAREERVIRERDEYGHSWQLYVTPEMVTNGTRGANEINVQAVHQRETEALLPAAYCLAESLRISLCALSHYDETMSIAAKESVTYGESRRVDQGTIIQVKRETLKKMTVYGAGTNVNVRVVTRSETDQEMTAREEAVANNVARGVSTWPELIGVRYSNVAKQEKALAKDGVRKQLAAKYDALVDEYATGRAQARFGQMWPGGAMPPAPDMSSTQPPEQRIAAPDMGGAGADSGPGVADAAGAAYA